MRFPFWFLPAGIFLAFLPLSTARAQSSIVQTIDPSGKTNYDASGFRTLNFDDLTTFAFNQFDSSQGTLSSVVVQISGRVRSDIGIENLDSSPVSNARAEVDSTFRVFDPNDNQLVSVSPFVRSTSTSLGAYDGNTDFGGSSGVSFTGLTSTAQSQTVTLSSTSDLAMFTGTNKITLEVQGNGASSAVGPSNYASRLTNSSGAPVITVTYNYITNSVAPEPGSLALLTTGGALGLGGLLRRRRRSV